MLIFFYLLDGDWEQKTTKCVLFPLLFPELLRLLHWFNEMPTETNKGNFSNTSSYYKNKSLSAVKNPLLWQVRYT